MSNDSLATQAVAQGPLTAAPPSFDGQGWLFVLNLGHHTASFYLMLMFCLWQGAYIWKNRERDHRWHPVTVWRVTTILMAAGYGLGSFAEMWRLWLWNPSKPDQTADALAVKWLIDPIASVLFWAGVALTLVAARGLVNQLRKNPLETHIWTSLPMLKRPAQVAGLCFAAAFLFVTFAR